MDEKMLNHLEIHVNLHTDKEYENWSKNLNKELICEGHH